MNQQIRERIGKRIRLARNNRGLTQEQFAELLGMERATLASYEVGRRPIEASDLPLLAHVLGVSILYFFQDEAPDPPQK